MPSGVRACDDSEPSPVASIVENLKNADTQGSLVMDFAESGQDHPRPRSPCSSMPSVQRVGHADRAVSSLLNIATAARLFHAYLGPMVEYPPGPHLLTAAQAWLLGAAVRSRQPLLRLGNHRCKLLVRIRGRPDVADQNKAALPPPPR